MSEGKSKFEIFVTHTLKGARFEGAAVPVSVLPDFAAYRELVVEVARALFFRDNPGRQRVPKGFEEGFDLVLRGVQEGSAVAALERRAKPMAGAQSQLHLLEGGKSEADYFVQAREVVTQTIESTREGRPAPPAFPLGAVRHFNNFGRTLRDGESIEIRSPRDGAVASYDRSVRKRLVLLRESTYEDTVEITGRVVQFDTQRRVFGILQEDRTTIAASLDGLTDEQLRTVKTAAVHTEDLRVRASGVGAFDRLDRLVRLVTVMELGFAEDEDLRERLDVRARLAVLAELQPGWLDGVGAPFEPDALDWVAEVLERAEGEGLVRPYLYPTPEGCVQAEWSFPGAEVSALFESDARVVSCVGVHTKSGAHRDEEIRADETDGIRRLVSFVGCFAP